MISDRLQDIRNKITAAAERSGRSTDEILMIAVSKTHPVISIRKAIQSGQEVFGESRVQEANEKIVSFGPEIRWHLVGHLQRNKAKIAVTLFDVIHSVDSYPLAEELNRRAIGIEKVQKILIQVNISHEQTKHGIEEEKVAYLAESIAGLPGLRLLGLMTIPPYNPDPEKSRLYFSGLREMRDSLIKKGVLPKSASDLSMGMSGDYEIAIEEGATMVRIGTAVFGER